MNIERYNNYIGATFIVPEDIGVIPKGCQLYCISQEGDFLHFVTSVDICGVRHLKLHRGHVEKLIRTD